MHMLLETLIVNPISQHPVFWVFCALIPAICFGLVRVRTERGQVLKWPGPVLGVIALVSLTVMQATLLPPILGECGQQIQQVPQRH